MNTGIISSRYAKALFSFAEEGGCAEAVASQVTALSRALAEVPGMRRVVADPVSFSEGEKLSIFSSALEGEDLRPELVTFLRLVMKNGREGELRLIFEDYLTLYYRSRGVVRCRLRTAVESDALIESLAELMRRSAGREILVETEVRPDLIGGFIFETDEYMVDASVAGQIETIRRQFAERN